MGKRLIFSALLLLASGCAGTRPGFFGKDPLAEVRRAFAEERHADVISAISGEAIARLPNRRRAEAYHLLGLSYERMRRPAKALQTYQLAVSLYPEDLKLLTDLANLLNQVGLPERARAHYERVLARHPNNAGAHLGLAEIFHKLGFFDESLSHYEKVLAIWRDNSHIWRGYGEALAAASKFEDALRAAERAHDIKPEAVTWSARARYKRALGRLEDAYADMDAAIRTAAGRENLGLERGLWFLEDGRLDEAAEAARSVLAVSPNEPLALWLRASVLIRAGRYGDARPDLESAAKSSLTHPFISKTAAAMLKRLEDAP